MRVWQHKRPVGAKAPPRARLEPDEAFKLLKSRIRFLVWKFGGPRLCNTLSEVTDRLRGGNQVLLEYTGRAGQAGWTYHTYLTDLDLLGALLASAADPAHTEHDLDGLLHRMANGEVITPAPAPLDLFSSEETAAAMVEPVETVERGAPPDTSDEPGLSGLEVVAASLESARAGQLPLVDASVNGTAHEPESHVALVPLLPGGGTEIGGPEGGMQDVLEIAPASALVANVAQTQVEEVAEPALEPEPASAGMDARTSTKSADKTKATAAYNEKMRKRYSRTHR
nr:hypothetical protein Hi04_10k_c5202_00019 [uncultured bacterium]